MYLPIHSFNLISVDWYPLIVQVQEFTTSISSSSYLSSLKSTNKVCCPNVSSSSNFKFSKVLSYCVMHNEYVHQCLFLF